MRARNRRRVTLVLMVALLLMCSQTAQALGAVNISRSKVYLEAVEVKHLVGEYDSLLPRLDQAIQQVARLEEELMGKEVLSEEDEMLMLQLEEAQEQVCMLEWEAAQISLILEQYKTAKTGNVTNQALAVQQVSSPPSVEGWAKIVPGETATYAIKEDETLWAWGKGTVFGLMPGVLQSVVPVQVPLADVVDVAVGTDYFVAVKSDGTVYWYGNNGIGLGSSSTIQATQLTDAVSVKMGETTTYVLKNDGTVWAWGGNQYGQVGNGTTMFANEPTQVSGLSNITSISAGRDFCMALDSSNQVWAWGSNYNKHLGTGDTTRWMVPTHVTALNGAEQVAAGSYYVLVKMADGSMKGTGGQQAWVQLLKHQPLVFMISLV